MTWATGDTGSSKRNRKEKRYIDITGNWLNHPNDYLARILAQVVIKISWNVKNGAYNEQVKD